MGEGYNLISNPTLISKGALTASSIKPPRSYMPPKRPCLPLPPLPSQQEHKKLLTCTATALKAAVSCGLNEPAGPAPVPPPPRPAASRAATSPSSRGAPSPAPGSVAVVVAAASAAGVAAGSRMPRVTSAVMMSASATAGGDAEIL